MTRTPEYEAKTIDGKTYFSRVYPSDISRYIRHAEAFAAQFDPHDETPNVRFSMWLGESLALAWKDIAQGETLLAFRGLLQVKEYVGRIGGYPPGYIADAILALRNELEAAVQAKEAA